MGRHRQHTDGELQPALTRLQHAIRDLTEPQTQKINDRWRHAPSPYMQLRDSINGEQGTGHGVARSMPPSWIDAQDLLYEIDLAVECWQPQLQGVPPTVGRLRALATGHRLRPWRPQDVHRVEQIIQIVTTWTRQITALLDPPTQWTVAAACPACGAETAYRTDSAGERVRVPALQIVPGQGCTCLVCRYVWEPYRYRILAAALDCPLPQGVLE